MSWRISVTLQAAPNHPASEFNPEQRQNGIAQQILDVVKRKPGMTELEIAKAIYGPNALQPQVNTVCRKLVDAKLIVRQGRGHSDPYVYTLAE